MPKDIGLSIVYDIRKQKDKLLTGKLKQLYINEQRDYRFLELLKRLISFALMVNSRKWQHISLI